MFCRKCGEVINNSDKFCASCGEKIIFDATPSENRASQKMENEAGPPWYRTGWVWLWLILFWPVGLYGLIKRADPKHQKWWWIGLFVLLVFVILRRSPDNTADSVAPQSSGNSTSSSIIESNGSGLGLTGNITAEEAGTVAALISAHGYKCTTVSNIRRFGPWSSHNGYTVSCNQFSYEYEVEDIGGNWRISVK